MSRSLSPIERMVDDAVRCVRCGQSRSACDCHRQCRCGRSHLKDEECSNPLHAVEQEARVTAKAVAASIMVRMAQAYPEPMRHASGGFRKTLRGYIETEVAQALVNASPHAPTEEEKRRSAEELEAAIDLFRRSPRGAA